MRMLNARTTFLRLSTITVAGTLLFATFGAIASVHPVDLRCEYLRNPLGIATSLSDVRESGKPARKAHGLTFIKFENGRAVFEAGSGNYRLSAKM